MAGPASSLTYDALCRQIDTEPLAPVYLLHGEEGYFIDRLSRRIEEKMPEDDREFNLHVLYAPQVEPGYVMDLCCQYPMMAERQIVILREAQAVNANTLNRLARYCSQPSPMTVLVICCRGAQFKGKELTAAVKAHGVIFESKRLADYNIGPIISGLIRDRGLTADQKSIEMLRDFVGTDASRLYNEIDKLASIIGRGGRITPELIERNIGLSNDYNNFELVDAIAAKDALKVFRIADYFRSNPKNNPLVVTTAALFNYFADLMTVWYTPDRSDRGLMEALKVRFAVQLGRYRIGMRNYNAFQIIEIIAAIRRYDAMSKGVGSRQGDHQLFRDLLFHIITAPGNIKF